MREQDFKFKCKYLHECVKADKADAEIEPYCNSNTPDRDHDELSWKCRCHVIVMSCHQEPLKDMTCHVALTRRQHVTVTCGHNDIMEC